MLIQSLVSGSGYHARRRRRCCRIVLAAGFTSTVNPLRTLSLSTCTRAARSPSMLPPSTRPRLNNDRLPQISHLSLALLLTISQSAQSTASSRGTELSSTPHLRARSMGTSLIESVAGEASRREVPFGAGSERVTGQNSSTVAVGTYCPG